MVTNQKGKQQKRLTSYFASGDKEKTPRQASRKRPRPVSGGSFRSTNGGSGFGVCPLCQVSFAWHVLEAHASDCTGATNSSKSGNNNVFSDQKVVERTTTAVEKSQSKTSIPEMPLNSEENHEPIIVPLENSDKHELPSNETPDVKTKAGEIPSTQITTSNIVTPRLAPIFQAKTRVRNTKDQSRSAQKQHLELRPHSYEPIPGLYVYEDFITEEEEALIVRGCVNVGKDVLPAWKQCRFNGNHIGKRWGVHCNLRDRRVDAPEHPLPEVLSEIVFPKLRKLNLPATKHFWPNEANAIDYRRREGHWLKAHVDDRKLSKEAIANLSIMGDCYMTFRNVSKHRNLAVSEQRVLLKRRCLQVLTGKARYDFSHAIANEDLLSDRRVSITMRESPLTTKAARTTQTTNHHQRHHVLHQKAPSI